MDGFVRYIQVLTITSVITRQVAKKHKKKTTEM